MQPRRHEDTRKNTKKNTKKDTKKNRFHVIIPMAIALAMSTTLRAQGPAREAEARAPVEADGTKYTTYQSLWVVTKNGSGWGVQARSSFAP